MSAKHALATILLWGVAFASLGGLAGGLLGVIAPDYYRSIIRRDRDQPADFHPVQMGIGLGVTQGLAAGIALSLGVLAIMAWRDLRRGDASATATPEKDAMRPRHWSVHLLWSVAMAIAVIVCGGAAFLIGGIAAQSQLYQVWTDRKLRRIDKLIDEAEFPQVRTGYSSAAQVYLEGSVRSEDERKQLYDLLVQGFGSEEGEFMLSQVEVVP